MPKNILVVCALFFITASSTVLAAHNDIPDMIGYILCDNFEKGELNAWETYPYAEDPGFDPKIVCAREPSWKNSKYSLSSTIEPNDTDYPVGMNLLGMTKKCRIRTISNSKLSAEVFLDGDRKAEVLTIILCSDDGCKYEWKMSGPPANQWIPVSCTIYDFSYRGERLKAGTNIVAVVVMAQYGLVSPHRSYTINLDDFELTGEADRRFIGISPTSTYLDKFYVTFLNRHFFKQEYISLSIKPQKGDKPVELKSVTCTVIDGKNEVRKKSARLYDDGSHGDTAASDGIWSNESIYRIGKNDPAGKWRVTIKGNGTHGKTVIDEFSFLVPQKNFLSTDHPRLFFSPDDIPGITEKVQNGRAKEIFDRMVERAERTVSGADIGSIVEGKGINEEFLDGGPFSTTWDDYSRWSNPGYLAARVVESGAIVYALAGDRESGEKAKEFLVRFAGFDVWNNPWFDAKKAYSYYPVGRWCQGLAMGYDCLHPLMTPVERALVRKALLEKAIIPHYVDQVENNRLPSNITNHIGMNTTGIILALLTLLGDDPDNPSMEPWLSGILTKYKAHIDAGYLPDGSYAEPVGYTSTDTEPLVKGLCAIERTLGIDWTTTTNVRQVYYYPAYTNTEDGLNQPVFGDGGRNWGAGLRRLHLWLAHRTGDRLAWGRHLWQNDRFKNREDLFDLLWMPENLKPLSFSELPSSRWFRNKGNAVFRSGWEEGGLLFVLRCGPHSNHYHFDQGSFWLVYNNEPLLTEAGLVNYYKNLYYRQFYIQPIAHNTLLLNDYPESQQTADFDNEIQALNKYPRIISCFTGDIIDSVEGELSCVYKGRLDTFKRSFVFVKPEYLVMYDELESPADERYTWLFHADGAQSITGTGNNVIITRPKAQLRMDVLAPSKLSRLVKKHVDQDMCFVQIGTPEPVREERFLAVMIPSKDVNADERRAWETSYVEHENWISAKIKRGTVHDIVAFRTDSGQTSSSIEGFETDSDRWFVSAAEDDIKRLWIRNATSLKDSDYRGGERTLFSSNVRLVCSVSYDVSGVVAEIESPDKAEIMVWTGMKPNRVTVNSYTSRFRFDKDTGLITFTIPAGENRVEIR